MYGWRVDPQRLRSLREEAQLTPDELAALVGCHPNHYRKLERRHQPSASLLWRILNQLARVLGRPVDITDIADPKPEKAVA